jgi:hypothetical protein
VIEIRHEDTRRFQTMSAKDSTIQGKATGTTGKTGEAKSSATSDGGAANPEKSLLEALEEDDEFEEFQPEHWSKSDTNAAAEAAAPTQQWMENWDDDIEDDFVKALRAELIKDGGAGPK